jgi:branched-chain amino acid transport system ATP-binding protein
VPGAEISIVGLRAGYGRIEVLHGIDLAVGPGEVMTVLGPNGAGKSTMLRVICAQLRPMAGSVTIGGRRVDRSRPERLAREGVCAIPEGRGVFPNLTVGEHLQMWTYRGGVRLGDLSSRVYERFPVLGERRRQLAGTLSGGEQQMLSVSRALCPGVAVLLLDELSMGLAPLVVTELYRFVAEQAASGVTVLVAEQFARVALGIATRAAVLAEGRLVATGTPAEIGASAGDAYLGAAATAS